MQQIDGIYTYKTAGGLLSESDFKTEKDLCDYIEQNIGLFCRDRLGVEYKSHVREYEVGTGRSRGSKRIDFLIESQNGEWFIVECKRPKHAAELTAAIGQVLGYLALLEDMESKYCKAYIVSTKLDWYMPTIVNRYNLPIGFMCLDKSRTLMYSKSVSDLRQRAVDRLNIRL